MRQRESERTGGIRLLIADDHAIVREGLKQILADAPDTFVIGEAANGVEALQAIRAQKWEVVLLDISMPDSNGLDILKQAKSEQPQLRVIILSMFPEAVYAVRAIRAGASGYVTKNSATKELAIAIHTVVKGGRYISAALAEKLAFDLGGSVPESPHEVLSDRELQVLRLIAQGLTTSEIAQELTLSVQTISTYRARILDKMRLKNNAALVRYAVENGLVE